MKIQSNFLSVYDVNMHYRSAGHGSTMLFLHGMPTSSFLWRKVIAQLSHSHYCVAPDLIGMGASEKPTNIAYTIDDHIRFIHGFIKTLNLKNITLVMHAWGSIIGFEYARLYPENVAGIVFYESHFKPSYQGDDLSLPIAEYMTMLKAEEDIYKKVIEENILLKTFMHAGMMHALTDEEMAIYTKPFSTPESRHVLLQYVNELPFGKKNNRVIDIVDTYSKFLQESTIPKLLLYSIPGFSTSIGSISWARQHMPNLLIKDIGTGLHFAQETSPEAFANTIIAWEKTALPN